MNFAACTNAINQPIAFAKRADGRPHDNSLRPIVIDTNIWLDILVFRNRPASRLCAQIEHLIQNNQLRIASCQATRAELADVLTRPAFGLSQDCIESGLLKHDRMACTLIELPAASMTRLRCRDRLDQKFLELAVCSHSRALLTRDKDLLKLAGRARREHHLHITDALPWLATIEHNRPPVPGATNRAKA